MRPALAVRLSLAASIALLASASFAQQRKGLSIADLPAAEASGGIFDPSFARAPDGSLWMSYSAVVPDPRFGARFNAIHTRLAFSADAGRTWRDARVVNASQLQPLPPPFERHVARWEHEVSRLLYDPWAEPAARWKLLWHRVLRLYDGKAADSTSLFEHGWMELRSAADPRGPWSSGRKLFVGSLYDRANNPTLGRPEIRLHRLHRGLRACAAFSEPGMIAREEGIYVALACHTGRRTGQIALLRCDHAYSRCEYLGALLRDADSARLGGGVSGFSGAELFERGDRAYLSATPTVQPGDQYRGCAIYRIASLSGARVEPEPVLRVRGDPGSFHGACGYAGAEAPAGIALSQFDPARERRFGIVSTGLHPD